MDLTKKQKIILLIITIIVVLIGCYYIYSKDNSSIIAEDENLDVIDNAIDENKSNDETQYSDNMIIVHISGAVNQEGIVELKTNSRIADAIDKAGGLREDAYIDKINLAYILEDGMKIYIPNINENKDNQKPNGDTSNAENNYITTESGIELVNNNVEEKNNNNNGQSINNKININKATQSELENLPGIGPSIAQKIISYRNEKGKFNKIEDIKNVSGIGDNKYDNIKDLISVK